MDFGPGMLSSTVPITTMNTTPMRAARGICSIKCDASSMNISRNNAADRPIPNRQQPQAAGEPRRPVSWPPLVRNITVPSRPGYRSRSCGRIWKRAAPVPRIDEDHLADGAEEITVPLLRSGAIAAVDGQPAMQGWRPAPSFRFPHAQSCSGSESAAQDAIRLHAIASSSCMAVPIPRQARSPAGSVGPGASGFGLIVTIMDTQ